MIVIEQTAGQALRIGPYTLRVLAVQPGRVVVALSDPGRDGTCDGQEAVAPERTAEHAPAHTLLRGSLKVLSAGP